MVIYISGVLVVLASSWNPKKSLFQLQLTYYTFEDFSESQFLQEEIEEYTPGEIIHMDSLEEGIMKAPRIQLNYKI